MILLCNFVFIYLTNYIIDLLYIWLSIRIPHSLSSKFLGMPSKRGKKGKQETLFSLNYKKLSSNSGMIEEAKDIKQVRTEKEHVKIVELWATQRSNAHKDLEK